MKNVRFSALALLALACPVLLFAQTELKPVQLEGVTGTAKTCPAGYIGSWPVCYSIITGGAPDAPPPPPPDWGSGGGEGDPNAPQPCDTSDARLNDDDFQDDMDDIWDDSNADDPNLAARTEKVAWVVKTATGYRLHEWNLPNSISGFCGLTAGFIAGTYPPEGPNAIDGFLHTHPWGVGESFVNFGCDGSMQIATYQGVPSDDDRAASRTLGALLGRPGALLGYILDKDGVRFYWGNLYGTGTYERCGY